VQVVVDDVEAHVAGPRDPAHGVQVRAVVVEQRARAVEDPRHLLDRLVEEAERGRVREHEAGRPLVDPLAEHFEVEVAARVGADLLELVSGHRHAGGIRAVSRVGDEDGVPQVALASIGEVRPHEHEAGQLALGSRGRLEGDGVEAGHFGEDLLEAPHELQRTLRAVLLLQRVQVAEAGQRHDPLVHPWVVLHRARAERIEARVDPEGPVGQPGEVTDELGLRQLGQARRARAGELGRHFGDRQVVRRERGGATARARLLEDEQGRELRHGGAHAPSTSASRSISAVVRFSVTATSRTSSRPS